MENEILSSHEKQLNKLLEQHDKKLLMIEDVQLLLEFWRDEKIRRETKKQMEIEKKKIKCRCYKSFGGLKRFNIDCKNPSCQKWIEKYTKEYITNPEAKKRLVGYIPKP